eukprot:scaffold1225_cov199-Alexandrium_tamarense.AAC.1
MEVLSHRLACKGSVCCISLLYSLYDGRISLLSNFPKGRGPRWCLPIDVGEFADKNTPMREVPGEASQLSVKWEKCDMGRRVMH